MLLDILEVMAFRIQSKIPKVIKPVAVAVAVDVVNGDYSGEGNRCL